MKQPHIGNRQSTIVEALESFMEPATRFELVSTAYETVALPIELRRLVALEAGSRIELTSVAAGRRAQE